MVGSYLHAAVESDIAFTEFLERNHDSIYNNRGNKYKDYEKADDMIETIKNDEFCMFALQGEKEVIYTGELFGVEWKIKVDNINHERGFFSDLKSTQELSKRYWSEKYNTWVSFVQAFDYVRKCGCTERLFFKIQGVTMIHTLWQLQKNRHLLKQFYISIQSVSISRKNMFKQCCRAS